MTLVALSGCRKDQNTAPAGGAFAPAQRYPISLTEAMAYFARVRSASSGQLDGSAFIDLSPQWNRAFTGQSQSGNEVLVVPLPDSALSSMNNGRVGAKLLFGKSSPDSIMAAILVYVADSAYLAPGAQALDVSNFTGLYLLYDLDQQFEQGVYVANGEYSGPVAGITGQDGPVSADDRTGDFEEDCYETFTSVLQPCVAFDDCYQLQIIAYYICNPGGGEGSGSNGSGSNTSNPYTNFWNVFSGIIPMNLFLEHGGTLPEGFTMDIFQHFVAIHDAYKFNPAQLDSLSKHPDYIEAIFNTLQVGTGEEWQIVKAVLDFSLAHDLSAEQLAFLLANGEVFGRLQELTDALVLSDTEVQWLAGNAAAINGFSGFLNKNQGEEYAEEVLQILIDYAVANDIENPLESNFSDYGETLFPCGACFSVAWSVDYAILKRDHPCPPNDWACDWELKAQATWNVIGSGVHLLLDGAGMVPVVGEIADLTNGAIYTLEGEYGDAALSFAAAVPFVGWTATGAKYARKIINVAGNAVELKYIVRNSDNIIEFGSDLAKGRSQLKRILKTPAGHEAHHIIPWELRNNEVIQSAAHVGSDQAFHMNELLNGISLPTSLGGLPQHLGSHNLQTE